MQEVKKRSGGRPPLGEQQKRQRRDYRFSPDVLSAIEQGRALAKSKDETAFLETAIDFYLAYAAQPQRETVARLEEQIAKLTDQLEHAQLTIKEREERLNSVLKSPELNSHVENSALKQSYETLKAIVNKQMRGQKFADQLISQEERIGKLEQINREQAETIEVQKQQISEIEALKITIDIQNNAVASERGLIDLLKGKIADKDTQMASHQSEIEQLRAQVRKLERAARTEQQPDQTPAPPAQKKSKFPLYEVIFRHANGQCPAPGVVSKECPTHRAYREHKPIDQARKVVNELKNRSDVARIFIAKDGYATRDDSWSKNEKGAWFRDS